MFHLAIQDYTNNMDIEYCTCDNQKIEPITDGRQYEGNIQETVIGYQCQNCNKVINPDTMPDNEETEADYFGQDGYQSQKDYEESEDIEERGDDSGKYELEPEDAE